MTLSGSSTSCFLEASDAGSESKISKALRVGRRKSAAIIDLGFLLKKINLSYSNPICGVTYVFRLKYAKQFHKLKLSK